MLFAWTNIALVVLVARLAPRITPPGGPWLGVTVALGAWMALAIGSVLGLGVVGLLAPLPLAGLVTAGLIGVLLAERSLGPTPVGAPWTAPTDGFTAGATALLAAAASVWLSRVGWSRTAYCFDDVVYHAAVPATWLQDGRIGPTAFTYQSYYAFDAELLSTWFMVPVGDPTHAGVAVLCFAALFVASTLTIGEALAIPAAPTLALLGAMFVSSRMLYFARTFSSTDLAMSAWVVAALALAMQPRTRTTAVLCGIAAGGAIGTKISAAGPLLALGLWWAWTERRRPGLPALFVLGSFALGSWWYVHNLAVTGNPVFPAEMGPFPGPLEPAAQRRTSLAFFVGTGWRKLGFWGDLLNTRMDWPLLLGVPAAFGFLVGGAAGWLPGRRRIWLVVAAGVAFLLLHPLQPFSGTINRPNAPLHGMVRYLTLPFALGLPLLASVTSRRDGTDRWVTGFGALAWMGCVALGLGELSVGERLGLGLGGALGLIGAGSVGSWPRYTGVGLVLAGVLTLTARTPAKFEATRDSLATFSRRGAQHAEAWKAVDALPAGSQLVWLSDLPPTHTFNLPLLGSRLQHEIVPIDKDGRALRAPLHARWRSEPPRWWSSFLRAQAPEQAVFDNLLESGADHLVLSRCHHSDGGAWPRPRDALLRTGPGHRVHRDTCVEIWSLEPFRGQDLVAAPKKKRKKKPKDADEAPAAPDVPDDTDELEEGAP